MMLNATYVFGMATQLVVAKAGLIQGSQEPKPDDWLETKAMVYPI